MPKFAEPKTGVGTIGGGGVRICKLRAQYRSTSPVTIGQSLLLQEQGQLSAILGNCRRVSTTGTLNNIQKKIWIISARTEILVVQGVSEPPSPVQRGRPSRSPLDRYRAAARQLRARMIPGLARRGLLG